MEEFSFCLLASGEMMMTDLTGGLGYGGLGKEAMGGFVGVPGLESSSVVLGN